VADFNRGWITRYNRDFGTDLSDDAVVGWDAPKDLTHFADMNEFWKWAKTCGEGKSLFRWLDPYPGAVDALDRLAQKRHRIVILTTKPSFAVHDTYAWLADNRIPTTRRLRHLPRRRRPQLARPRRRATERHRLPVASPLERPDRRGGRCCVAR